MTIKAKLALHVGDIRVRVNWRGKLIVQVFENMPPILVGAPKSKWRDAKITDFDISSEEDI
jgi:hypothetical protein